MDQLVVETRDGVFSRSSKIDKNIRLKGVFHSEKIRSEEEPFAELRFKLSDRIIDVQRVYPNIIDFLSNYGGLVEVILFFVHFVMTTHHNIIMQKFLINQAILQKSASVSASEISSTKQSKTE